MANSLTSAQIQLTVAAALAGTLNTGLANAALSMTPSTAIGASLALGAGLADTGWWDKRTLTASSSETIDFNGTLRDPFNNLINLVRLKVLIISADLGNTNNVVIGGGTTTMTTLFGATTHTTSVRPGGTVVWLTATADSVGYAITAGSSDLLQIANSGAGSSVIYTIVALGVST